MNNDTTALVPANIDAGKYFSPDQVELIKSQIAKGCTNDELKLFLYQAARTGLDPLSRQIYAIRRKQWDPDAGAKVEKMSIQTGIDGFRLVADRTGRYAPGRDTTFEYADAEKTKVTKATAYVMKLVAGTWHEVSASAMFWEYAQTKHDGSLTQMWADKPHIMLGKCAEALAIRKAFPAELSGLYTADEMGQADNVSAPVYTPPGGDQGPKADSASGGSSTAGTGPSQPATSAASAGAPPAAATVDPKEPPKASGKRSSRGSAGKSQASGNGSGTTKPASPPAGTSQPPDVAERRKKLWDLAQMVKAEPPKGCGWNDQEKADFISLFQVDNPNKLELPQLEAGQRLVIAFMNGADQGEQGWNASMGWAAMDAELLELRKAGVMPAKVAA